MKQGTNYQNVVWVGNSIPEIRTHVFLRREREKAIYTYRMNIKCKMCSINMIRSFEVSSRVKT